MLLLLIIVGAGQLFAKDESSESELNTVADCKQNQNNELIEAKI